MRVALTKISGVEVDLIAVHKNVDPLDMSYANFNIHSRYSYLLRPNSIAADAVPILVPLSLDVSAAAAAPAAAAAGSLSSAPASEIGRAHV